MQLKVNVDPVRTLEKISTISLIKLIFVFTSSSNDTIRDTLTSSTTPPLNVTSTVAQTLGKNYALKALRSWKVVAEVKDAKDSVTNQDSATTPVLLSGDTAHVSLNLSSAYFMYEARFLTIPDSISSATNHHLPPLARILSNSRQYSPSRSRPRSRGPTRLVSASSDASSEPSRGGSAAAAGSTSWR